MAFGDFLGFEPSPMGPGALDFTLKNGQKMTLTGPPAANLAQRIEQANRFAAQPVAGPGGAPDMATQYANWQPKGPPPAAAPPPGDGLAGPAGPAGATQPASAEAPPPSIARPQGEGAPQQSSAGGYVPIGYGAYRGPDGQIYKRTGGTKAVTREDLQAEAANRVALPQSQSTTVEGGFPQDPEYLRASNELMDQEVLALGDQRALAQERAEMERQIAADDYARKANDFKQQQEIQAQIQAKVQADEATAQKAREEFNGARVDPNRMFKGEGGTATAIVAALAAGLGAFGATLGRTENFALNSINSMIDRDISAQENEIKVKGDAANNALSQLNRSTGSLEQSKLLLRELQAQWAMAQAASVRSTAKSAEVDAQYGQLAAGMEKNILDWNEARRRESLGRATVTTAEAFASPRAGTSGGFAPIGTPQQQVGFGQSVQNLGAGEADIQAKNAQTAKTVAEIKGGGKPGTKGARSQADIEAGTEALDNIGAEAGLLWNPETQEYEGDAEGVLRTGYGASDRSQRIGAAVGASAAVVGRALEGNAPNESTMNEFREGIVSASGDKMKANLTQYRRNLEARKAASARNPGGAGDDKEKDGR